MSSNKNFSLVIQNISFSYGTFEKSVLEDISIEIPKGTVTSILGLNGSGKTTLLLIILGYLKPKTGEILLKNGNGKLDQEKLNGKVGYLPQRENIPFDYPVNEFVLMGRLPLLNIFGRPEKDDYDEVNKNLELLNLSEFKNKKLFEISGGELQRVRIARTLIQNPVIVLLDEPMTHLDIKHKNFVMQIMKEMAEQGKIVIYSSHDPLDAIKRSDYCILMTKFGKATTGKSADVISPKNLTHAFETKISPNLDYFQGN